MTTPSKHLFQQEQQKPNLNNAYSNEYDLLSYTTIVLPDIKTNLPFHQHEHQHYSHQNMPSNSSATVSTYNARNSQTVQNIQNNNTLHYLSPLSDIHTHSSINNANRIHLMHRQNTFKSTSSETNSSPTISYELPYLVNHSHAQSMVSSAGTITTTTTTDSSQLYQYVLDMKAGGLPYIEENPEAQDSSQHSLPPSTEVQNEQKPLPLQNENSSTFTTYTHGSSSTFNTYNIQQRDSTTPISDIADTPSPHPSLYTKPNITQFKRNGDSDQLQKRRRMQSQPQKYQPLLQIQLQTRPKSNTIQLSDISYANNNNRDDKYVRFSFKSSVSSPSLQSDESRSGNSSILNTIVYTSAVDDQSKIINFSNDGQQRNAQNFSYDSDYKQNDISLTDFYENKPHSSHSTSKRTPVTPCDFRGNALFENASGTPNTEFSTNAIQFSPVVHITLKQDLMLLNTDDDGPQQTTEYTVYNERVLGGGRKSVSKKSTTSSCNSDIKVTQSETSPTWSPSIPIFVYNTTDGANVKSNNTNNTSNANSNRLMCVV